VLAHDAEGWGEGREAWGRLLNAGRCLRMMQKGGERGGKRGGARLRNAGMSLRMMQKGGGSEAGKCEGRLRETCVEAVREQTFGESTRFVPYEN
jgi:hypothetical protein